MEGASDGRGQHSQLSNDGHESESNIILKPYLPPGNMLDGLFCASRAALRRAFRPNRSSHSELHLYKLWVSCYVVGGLQLAATMASTAIEEPLSLQFAHMLATCGITSATKTDIDLIIQAFVDTVSLHPAEHILSLTV